MQDYTNDGIPARYRLKEALGNLQIAYWCEQLDCTEDELLNAVQVVGFDAQDLDLYMHHLQ